MTNRRAFLATLAAAATGSLLDPERLTWVPGKVAHFDIQRPLAPNGWAESISGLLVRGDIVTIEGVYEISPKTHEKLPFLKQFIVIEDGSIEHAAVKLHPEVFVPVGRPKARALAWAPPVKGRRQ
ncbi:MAG: hypothetical protein ACYC2H_01350 [Thermoplasmatota archaeon]